MTERLNDQSDFPPLFLPLALLKGCMASHTQFTRHPPIQLQFEASLLDILHFEHNHPSDMAKLVNEILLYLVQNFLDLREAVYLSQSSCTLYYALSEEQWQTLLGLVGLGKPNHYSHLSWKWLAGFIIKHREQCGACAWLEMSYKPGLKRNFRFEVLDRTASMVEQGSGLLTNLATPMTVHAAHEAGAHWKQCHVGTAPLVKFYAGDTWADRICISPEFIVKALAFRRNLEHRSAQVGCTDSFLGDMSADEWALVRHPMLACLFVFYKPVSSMNVDATYAIQRHQPGHSYISRLANPDGITTLDLMQDVAQRHDVSLPERPCECRDRAHPMLAVWEGALWFKREGLLRLRFA